VTCSHHAQFSCRPWTRLKPRHCRSKIVHVKQLYYAAYTRNNFCKWRMTNSVAQEPEGSSPQSQQPATSPYPEPVESNPHPPKPIYLRSILIPTSHLRLGLTSGLFPSGFPAKTLYNFPSSPMRVCKWRIFVEIHTR
jgi:hypothetical protein